MRRTLDQVSLADLAESEGRINELLRARLSETVLEPPSSLIPLTMTSRAEGADFLPKVSSEITD